MDEMNLHICQTLESRYETATIASTEDSLISAQGSNPVVGVVQDSLVVAYKLTKEFVPIGKEVFMGLCIASGMELAFYEKRLKEITVHLTPERVYSGYGLFSMLFPNDFAYSRSLSSTAGDFKLQIRYGVVFSGPLDKSSIGTKSSSIISYLAKEYSNRFALDFIAQLTKLTCAWTAMFGFSVGYDDCIPVKQEEIKEIIFRAFIKAETSLTESERRNTLESAKNACQKLAAKSFAPDNGFLDIVYSGAKGSVDNLTQITGILGQQHFAGARIQPQLSHGSRSLPCYPLDGKGTLTTKYEGAGFVSSSFYHGLNSREFFLHSIAGRAGIVSTSNQTAKAGYAERRIIKRLDGAIVKYDGTVRSDTNLIIQYHYGEDPAKLVRVDDSFQSSNIYRLAEKLNQRYENGLRIGASEK